MADDPKSAAVRRIANHPKFTDLDPDQFAALLDGLIAAYEAGATDAVRMVDGALTAASRRTANVRQ